ncbi:MAG: hypothetical protein WCJ01_09945 [Ignavibacteria bacterium]
MKKTVLFWILSFVITIITAYYQRVTGPTYPLSGTSEFDNNSIRYKFERSHSCSENASVIVPVSSMTTEGVLKWKRYKTTDSFTVVKMGQTEGKLVAELPKQPSAGKLEYFVVLTNGDKQLKMPEKQNIVIRFKGDVPPWILIPHIIAMFGTMLLSTRTGLEFFNKGYNLKKLTFWTLGFLIIGGMVLGPLTQLYAFNALWTGIPFGTDLTDNKTLIALAGWLIALIALYKAKRPEAWALFAAVLLTAVYMIPHSLFGSELDYNKMEKQQKSVETIKPWQD